MLQQIHDKITGWIAGIVLALIVVPFVFWGIDVGFGQANYAAKVNGEKISEEKVRRTYQEQLSQYQAQTKSEIPAELKTQFGNQLLDQYILMELLTQQTRDRGYRVTGDDVLKAYETALPDAKVGGKFNREVAKQLLQSRGMSISEFEAEQFRTLPISQLEAGIASSSFVTPAELERLRALEGEEREASWAVISADKLAAGVTPEEKAIQAYYDQNKSRFMTPETVTLKYVELRVQDVAQTIAVTEDALRALYEERKDHYTVPEKRRGRHILFQVGQAGEDAAARKKAEVAARQKADDVLARVKKGEDFAKLAKQLSEDAGSAEQGGDLDWHQRGDLVGPFEDALFSMKDGEVRGPVRTEFGYHVIRLDAIQPGKQKTFEEARPELEQEYRTQEAEKIFGDRQDQLAAKAFENLDNLDAAAKAAGQEVRTLEGFTREIGGGPFTGKAEVIEAAFSKPVLADGQNSQPIELEPGHILVLRAENDQPPKQKPLQEVRDPIVAELKKEGGISLAKAQSEQIIGKLRAGSAWSGVLADSKLTGTGPKFVTRLDDSIPDNLRQALFNAPRPVGSDSGFSSIAMPNGDYAVLVFSKSRAPQGVESPQQRATRARQLADRMANSEMAGYVAELRRGADIERNPKVFE